MKTKLSIVIPSYNTNKILEECITSIYKTESDKDIIEIIVVDNASTDNSVDIVRKKFPDVTLILNNVNFGFAKAVNQGWMASKSELVLFLNSDTVIRSRNTFSDIVKFFNNNNNVGALSGKLHLKIGGYDSDTHRGFPDPWSSFTFFTGLEKLFPKSRLFARYHMGWENMDSIHEIEAGCGAFLVVRKSVLEELKGWDEEYFFYGEDIDLCYRIKKAGWKIVYYPYLDVLHYKGASSGLRKESRNIVHKEKENLLKVAGASVAAWERFYRKFYKNKYPSIVTTLVLIGIKLKGTLRIIRHKYF